MLNPFENVFLDFIHRFRGSRAEHLDSIGMQSNVMDMNGCSRHRSPLPPPPTTVHLVNGNGTIEQWSKLADQTNGQDQVLMDFIHFHLSVFSRKLIFLSLSV